MNPSVTLALDMKAARLTVGSLFSGIGGLERGLELAGLGPVLWQVEQDPFCLQVLANHWPNAERFADVRTVKDLPSVDVICGGFPCQDVSAAGKGAGLSGERSGLWQDFRRIVEENSPRFVIVENVASGAKRWLCEVRSDLHELGYRTRALGISAADVGAPHLRRRIFVLAYAEREFIREQQRGRSGEDGQRPTVAKHLGQARDVSDTDSVRELQSQGIEQDVGRRTSDTNWWAVEPGVGCVAHGVSGGVARLRALGNAVVPQCAEIAGRALLALLGVA